MADPGAAQLWQMIRGYWVSQVVGTMAQLEIADHLARGPLDSSTLAKGIGCDPDATFRLLRALVNVGIVSMSPDGRFGLTPLGELLRSNVPGSMRDSAIAFTAPGHWLPWGRLADAVRRGEQQAVAALGHELFDYLAINPHEGDAFTGAMAAHSNMIAKEVAQALDTSEVDHLVDIGGASGTIIGALLETNPVLRGTIFERADVVRAPKPRWLSGGCPRVAGSSRATSSRASPKATSISSNPSFTTGTIIGASKFSAIARARCGRMAGLFSSNGSFPSVGTRARRRSPTSICSFFSLAANEPQASMRSCFARPD